MIQLFLEHIDDVIALIIVIGAFILILIKCEYDMTPILTMAAGYAFGKTQRQDNSNKEDK